MPPIIQTCNIRRCARVSILVGAVAFGGCATSPVTHAPVAVATISAPLPAQLLSKPHPVVRSGRYTLVELMPGAAQQDLLLQVIDISIPGTMSATVGDALRYLLLRSGYQLCDAQGDASTLYALPLPAAHFHLGPVFVRDALQTLAGSAWHLQVDEVVRQVCFTRAATAADTPPIPPSPAKPAPLRAETAARMRALPERRP